MNWNVLFTIFYVDFFVTSIEGDDKLHRKKKIKAAFHRLASLRTRFNVIVTRRVSFCGTKLL